MRLELTATDFTQNTFSSYSQLLLVVSWGSNGTREKSEKVCDFYEKVVYLMDKCFCCFCLLLNPSR